MPSRYVLTSVTNCVLNIIAAIPMWFVLKCRRECPVLRLLFSLAAICALTITTAPANDSSAELAAGGLVLVKTDAVNMQREDLFLSESEVRVRYEMYNGTGAPVTLRLAFPMPEVPSASPAGFTSSSGEHNIAIAPLTDANFIDFRVTANGQSITPNVEIKTLLNGRDIADTLRTIGGEALLLKSGDYFVDEEPLSEETIRRLKAVQAYQQVDSAIYRLPWKTYITFHWMQTFQPGVTIIEHSYKPVIGHRLIYAGDQKGKGSLSPTLKKEFCIDPAMSQSIRNLTKRETTDGHLFGTTLSYIVKTARNWKGGAIGTFHLKIQGTPATRITALCTELPLVTTGENRFVATVHNYKPKSDLRILFLRAKP